MEQVRSTFTTRGIPDELWPKVMLAMIYILNLLLTSALNGRLPFETSTQSLSNLKHLQILGSTIYVFICEKEKKAKLAK